MKNIEYYLNKGFDLKTARYFSSGRKKIVRVLPCNNYKLLLQFDNGENRLLDMASIIQTDTVFEFLSDQNNFNRVYLDENSCVSWDIDPNIDSTVVWNNKVDLSSDSCYMDSESI